MAIIVRVIFSNKGSLLKSNLAKIMFNEKKINNARYMRRKNMYQNGLNGPLGALSPPRGRRGVKKSDFETYPIRLQIVSNIQISFVISNFSGIRT